MAIKETSQSGDSESYGGKTLLGLWILFAIIFWVGLYKLSDKVGKQGRSVVITMFFII